MSKARGVPLQDLWKPLGENNPISAWEKKTKIMYQLGAITWQLSRIRFNKIGSLFEEGKTCRIQTCLSHGLVANGRDTLEHLHRGPFSSENEYYRSQFSAFFEHAKYLPLHYHCFLAPVPKRTEYSEYSEFKDASDRWNDFVTVNSKVDTAENRSNYIIAGHIVQDMFSDRSEEVMKVLRYDEEKRFPLHHPDLNANNIFVDKDFNITCIIDWAFCSSVPASVLLIAPGLPQTRDGVDPVLLPAYISGLEDRARKDQTNDIHGEISYSQILDHSHLTWLLSHFLNLDSTADYYIFGEFCKKCGLEERLIRDKFRTMQVSDQYIAMYEKLREEDQSAEQVARFERDYFGDDMDRLAISRKLTLVSQCSFTNKRSVAQGIRAHGRAFVADKKLWKWVERCLE